MTPRIVSIQTTSERGGAEYANVDLLEALRRRGHSVLLLTNLPVLAAGTDVPVETIEIGPKLSLRSVRRVALDAPRTLWRIARQLRAARPVGATLVHFKKEQLLCSMLPRRLTGEVVWCEWGPVPPALRQGLPRLAYALAARRPREILAVSEGTAETVRVAGAPPGKVRVLSALVNVHTVGFDPAGRERIRQGWGVGEQTLVVGCMTRFQRRKRTDVVVDAMAHLGDDVVLVLAGEGEEEQDLRRRAAPYGDRVHFIPNVRGDVDAFLSACDVFVFAPSPTEADRPRAIVMAQQVGLPVISTHPEGAASLQAPGTGTIASPHHDPQALAQAISAYRDDPELRRTVGQSGRAALAQWRDPDRVLDEVERALGPGFERGRGEAGSPAAEAGAG